MIMTAKQLAEKLLETPEATVEVEVTYPDSEYLDREWTERRDDLYPNFIEQDNKIVIVACGGRYI